MSIRKGLKCLVTGAGRGIGRALVAELHARGAVVYALSKNPDNLKKLKIEFPKVVPICADLGSVEDTRRALEPIEAVDCLINNAGIFEPGDFLEATSESFDKQFNINLRSALTVSQITAKKMIARGNGGSIVNISSISGQRPEHGIAIYCCTKAAIDMLTKCMALELGPHKIRVNAVAPANVDTDLNQPGSYGEEEKEKVEQNQKLLLQRTPTGTLWMPMSDIVNTTLFLASDLTSQITGQVLAVDGGYLAN
ncbi:L-xylulose reductase [Orchesella cincta]|uniref:L-xylulose reductase n=1 Tax=Orchesella cincta TaxID=48709 RepID=A0A1D2MLD0_ORCCI|nr:L-xylulose reductase [Orchesella cincta]